MSKKLFALFVVTSMFSAACTTHKANFGYSEFKNEMPIKAGPVEGEELGAVDGSHGGFVWTQCSDQARDAVQDLIANARAKGANAVGNVKWRADGTSDPTCKKSWGFVMIWPFMFTPLFASSHVDGTAYKTNGARKAGVFQIPTDRAQDAALVEEILAAR